MKVELLIFFFLTLAYQPNYAQNIRFSGDTIEDESIQAIKEKIEKSNFKNYIEKVYLHFDKSQYLTGETIWIKGYLLIFSTHQLSGLSKVLYVELIDPDGNIVITKRFSVEDGLSIGHMDIPNYLKSGIYGIRSYTNGMKNFGEAYFFYQPVEIINYKNPEYANKSQHLLTDFDVQFFPEGGDLINGISSRIAFKAIDNTGMGIMLSGTITDESGYIIAQTNTRHDGMGSFFMIPRIDKSFYFEADYQGLFKKFRLPEPKYEGFVMNINNHKDDNVQIFIKCSESLIGTDTYVVGLCRGNLVFQKKITTQTEGIFVEIPRYSLPKGIIQFTLFDSDLIPRTERLVFIKNPSTQILFEPQELALTKRSKVDLLIKVTDALDLPVRFANLSIAVTDADQTYKNKEQESISSYLLLTSDLKGPVFNPGYYFSKNSREVNIALDLLMMTQGWRRFTWKNIFEFKPVSYKYAFEKGFTVSGTAYLEQKNTLLENGILHILSLNDLYPGFWTSTTDTLGRFEVNELLFSDSLEVVVKAINQSGKLINIDLEFDKRKQNKTIDKYIYLGRIYQNHNRSENIRIPESRMVQDSLRFKKSILLKEIEVRGEPYYQARYGKPDASIVVNERNENYTDIFQLIKGKVPGVQVYGMGINTKISIRGDTYPLIILDGVPLNSSPSGLSLGVSRGSSNSSGSGGSNSSGSSGSSQSRSNESFLAQASQSSNASVNAILLSIPPSDVERIDVLKTYAATSTYGMTGSKGVIIIYTKKGIKEFQRERSKGYEGYYLQGFDLVREFYSPKYEDDDLINDDVPDLRSTLYWEPLLTTDRNGFTEISFYNSDAAHLLQIDIQGISEDGNPINFLGIIGTESSR